MGNCQGCYSTRLSLSNSTDRPIKAMENKAQTAGLGKSKPIRVDKPIASVPDTIQIVKLKPVFRKTLVSPIWNTPQSYQINEHPFQEFFEVKVPKDFNTWTEFQWFKQQKYIFSQEIKKSKIKVIRERSFQQKYAWFRLNLQEKRIPWNAGKSEYLEVDRNNLIMPKNDQLRKINFYKELKIVFKQQKETSDAGGLIRQWMNLCIKEIFRPETNLMKLCDTRGTFYKLNYDQKVSKDSEAAAKMLGIIIGKAIFERIPLKCSLNYTILRQLCGQLIQINDIYSYDKDFYSSWQYMINNSMVTALQQNFCVYEVDENGKQIAIPLKENGYDIMVNSTNKEQYIQLMIEYYCTTSVEKVLQSLKSGLYSIIPKKLLKVFEPHELDLLISGKQQIDVQDLRINTVYTGYKPQDHLILMFWEYLRILSQQKLENMLHFVTGTGRVPISGFKYLESNRGEIQCFHIVQVPYDPVNPYPKSHTCFNRLQLPAYPNDDLFFANIEYITSETEYFGLE